MNQIDLSHRHAIVTGGAQGIGLAIARRFLASGASVTLWDRDGELLASAARELGALGAVDSVMTDVTQAESIAAPFGKDFVTARLGLVPPDILTL